MKNFKFKSQDGRTRRRVCLGFLVLNFAFLISSHAVTLLSPDASTTTSFTGNTNWSDGLAPHSSANYLVAVSYLRTPPDANNYTFAGASLTITNGGGMIYKGTATSQTYTINPLILHNGGIVRSGAGSGNTMTLAGTISVQSTNLNSQIQADQSPYVINSGISGAGNLAFSGSYAITLNGTNSTTGNTLVANTVTLGTSGLMNFKINGSGSNNSISGSGSATFNGSFSFDLSNASTNLGDSWTVASVTTESFGTTFSVAGFARVGGSTGAGTWQIATNGAYYSFSTSSGVLQVVFTTNPVVAANVPVVAAPIEADLLASYAASYAASVGGDDNAQVTIANTVAGSNAIQDQGGTGAHMRIAGFYQSTNDVTGLTTTGGIVTWLANNDSHLSDVVAQGAAVGADLVVYICNNTDSSSIAGVSQQPGYYSSLNPGAVWSAVFAHETGGHCYGRAHADGKLSPKTIMLHNYCGGGAAPPYFYSNPKIWFNGVQLLGDGATTCPSAGTPQINGGDNSTCSAQAVADRRARVIVGPGLNNVIFHWMFTNAPGLAPAETTNLDLVSSAPAIVRGNGAFYTGTTLRIPGGTTGNVAMNAISAYIDLPNGILSSQTNVTIEIWATPLSAPNWARIMDFGRATQSGDGLGAAGEYTGAPGDPAPGTTTGYDDVLLSAAINTSITSQRFEAMLAGVATNLDSALATVAGVPHDYAITFTDGAGFYSTNGGRWQWFRDGDPVAYLDVSNHLAAIHDVNNWLGRSQWSSDSLANNDYAEVRISNVALSRGQILANYLLGANYVPAATVMLTNSDAANVSSFNAAGQWSNGSSPAGANSYETFDFTLGTPNTGSSYTFGGNALKISGGSLLWQGTAGSTITITNLTLNSGSVRNGGSGTCTLAGNLLTTNSGGVLNAVNGAITLAANLNGSGPLTFLGNNAVTLSGTNAAFAGKLFVGDGMAGVVTIDSQARLGATPTNFISNLLDLNRGTLKTTTTFSLSATNRGILLDISGGTFDVAPGTTLTISSPLMSPAAPAGYNVIAGAITKADSGTLVLSSPTNTFLGTLYVDSGSTTANDGVVKIVNNQVLAAAHSPIYIDDNNSGSSTLQLDGTTGNITLPQQIALSGRSSSFPAVENLAGTNTISGGISINVGGGNYWIQSDAGLLNLAGTISAAATGARTFTFLGNGNLNVTGTIADGSATDSVAKSGSGTLILGGNNTYSGTTVLSAGTLLVNGSIGSGAVTANAGTLGGIGTINGPVTIQSGATFAPGTNANAVATFAVNNSLTLAAGGATTIKLSKNGGVTTNDLITGLTSLNCGGTLVVTNIGTNNFAAGDTFQIFSGANFSGTFSATNLPPLAGNLVWQNNLAVNGSLSVVVPVSTTPTNIVWNLSGGNLVLSWPSDHTGWRLLIQTNNLANGVSANTNDWMTVFNSTATNSMTFPLNSILPDEFFRLIYP